MKIYMVRYGRREYDSSLGLISSSYRNKLIGSEEKMFGTEEKAKEFSAKITEAMTTLYGLANWEYPTITEKELE